MNMFNWLGAIAGLVLASNANAAPLTGDWPGVYRGTIGKLPVVACLDGAGYGSGGRGSYYYLRHLVPIPLWSEAIAEPWFERSEGGSWEDKGGPTWSLEPAGKGALRGTWSDKDRKLPIRLQQAVVTEDLACGNDAFVAPRVIKAEFDRTPASIGNFHYTGLVYRSPKHFPDVAIGGFTFDPSEPGDPAIIAALSALLPSGSTDDDYVQCMAGSLQVSGRDGDLTSDFGPAFVNRNFLAVAFTEGSYCGGAHPNYATWQVVFDRHSGQEIDLKTWFGGTGFGTNEWGSPEITAKLRDLALERWPQSVDAECVEAAREQTSWQLGLVAGGVEITPDFPHVLTACEEPAVIPWRALEPYLSAKGKAAMALAN